jgi:hypothetical protein
VERRDVDELIRRAAELRHGIVQLQGELRARGPVGLLAAAQLGIALAAADETLLRVRKAGRLLARLL